MTRSLKKMPTPLGIGAGQTATVNLPLGLTYERLYIRCNAQIDPGGGAVATDLAAADWDTVFGDFRVMVNGDAQMTASAAQFVALNQFYGQTLQAGSLPIFLSRPWMRTPVGEDQSGYGTVGMATFSLEMDVKAGQTINSLEVYALQSKATNWGSHLRIQRYTRQQGVTGQAEIADIVRGNYAMYALHVDTDQITDAQVFADNRKVVESDASIRAAHYAVVDRVPQAGFTHLDFVADNRLADALPMNVQDFRLKLNFQQTGNFNILAESLTGAAA